MNKSIVIALLLFVFSSVSAAPVTLNFTGVINFASDYTGSLPSVIGTTFSGYVTYDVANAELISFQESNPGNTAGFASSKSGCSSQVNGVCDEFHGTDTPVVTDYQFNWVGGVVTPWEYSLDVQDSSRRGNIFDIPPAPITGEGWDVQRNQFASYSVGDLDNYNYTRTLTKQSFGLQAYSNDNAFLSGTIDDFVQGFDTDILFSNGRSSVDIRDFTSVETCVAVNDCTTTYNAGSYSLTGELTSASFSVVPIPSAVWLFGSGLLGLIGLTRRKANV